MVVRSPIEGFRPRRPRRQAAARLIDICPGLNQIKLKRTGNVATLFRGRSLLNEAELAFP